MRSSSDQRSSDAADQEPSADTAVVVEQKLESPSSEDEVQEFDEADEEFDGFDGSWDYEWIVTVDAFMEAIPDVDMVAVFIGGSPTPISSRNDLRSRRDARYIATPINRPREPTPNRSMKWLCPDRPGTQKATPNRSNAESNCTRWRRTQDRTAPV